MQPVVTLPDLNPQICAAQTKGVYFAIQLLEHLGGRFHVPICANAFNPNLFAQDFDVNSFIALG
jgi:hypothetical protein